MDYLFGEDINVAHILSIVKKIGIRETTKNYLVTQSESQINGETIANVGMKITLMEIPPLYDLVSVSPNLYVYSTTTGTKTLNFGDNGRYRALMKVRNNIMSFLPNYKTPQITLTLTSDVLLISTRQIANAETQGLTQIQPTV